MRVLDASIPEEFQTGLVFLFLGFQSPVRCESLCRTRVLCTRGLLRRLSIRILSPVDTASEQCDCLSPAGWCQRHCVVREGFLRSTSKFGTGHSSQRRSRIMKHPAPLSVQSLAMIALLAGCRAEMLRKKDAGSSARSKKVSPLLFFVVKTQMNLISMILAISIPRTSPCPHMPHGFRDNQMRRHVLLFLNII